MQVIADISTCVVLFLISIQDFRHRSVAVWLLLLLAMLQVASMLLQVPVLKEMGYIIILNGCFLMVNMLLICVYFSLKYKKWVNIIDVYIGKADIALLGILVFSFSPLWYLLFFTAATAATIAFVILTRLLIKNYNKEIPMAGTISICLLIAIAARYCNPAVSFYNDSWIVNKMIFLL